MRTRRSFGEKAAAVKRSSCRNLVRTVGGNSQRYRTGEAITHDTHGAALHGLLRREKIHVSGSVSRDRFRRQRSFQLADAVHGFLIARLEGKIDKGWLAGSVERVGHQYHVALGRKAAAHIALRRANSGDVGEMNHARPASRGFGLE